MQTFENFINEAYSSADKQALINELVKSISFIVMGTPQKSTITGAKAISDTEIRIDTEFESITLKITKIQ